MATYIVSNDVELAARMAALSNNDVIRMHAGTYAPYYSATGVTGVTIEAYGDGTVTCNGGGSYAAWLVGNNWTFSGLDFTNYGNFAIRCSNPGTSVDANDLYFYSTAGGFTNVYAGLIERCRYVALTKAAVEMRNQPGADLTIVNNDVYDHQGGHAVHLQQKGRLLYSTLVENNQGGQVPVNLSNVAPGMLVHGTIVLDFAFSTWGICVGNSSLVAADPGAYAQYCWAADGGGALHTMTGTGCLEKDPLLIDNATDRHPDVSAFHTPGQEPWGYVPAITGTPTVDVLGDSRFQILGKDTIGAYAADARTEYDTYTDFPDVYHCVSAVTTAGLAAGNYVRGAGSSDWVGRICYVRNTQYFDIEAIRGVPTSGDTITNSAGITATINGAVTHLQDPSSWPPPALPVSGDTFAGAASSGTLVANPTNSQVRYPDPDLPLVADALIPFSVPAWGNYLQVVEIASGAASGLVVGEEVWELATLNTYRVVAIGDLWISLEGLGTLATGASLRSLDSGTTVTTVRVWAPDEYSIPDVQHDRYTWVDEPIADSYVLKVHLNAATSDPVAPSDVLTQQGTSAWRGTVVAYSPSPEYVTVVPVAGYPRSQPVRGETLEVVGSPAKTVEVRTEDWALQWEPGATDVQDTQLVVSRVAESAPSLRFPNKPPVS